MKDKAISALNWLKDRVWFGRESGSDFLGVFNVVYLRVGRYTVHVGIDRTA